MKLTKGNCAEIDIVCFLSSCIQKKLITWIYHLVVMLHSAFSIKVDEFLPDKLENISYTLYVNAGADPGGAPGAGPLI